MHLIGMVLWIVCAVLQPGEPITDQRVRAWLESELATGRTHRYASVPIEAAYTFELIQPGSGSTKRSCSALYAGSNLWYRSDRTASNALREAGGLDDVRWMRYINETGGQTLTIIGASLPCPTVYNVSRYLDELHEELSLILHGGLPSMPADTTIESVTVNAPAWKAKLISRSASTRGEVTGRWSPELDAMIVERIVIDIDSPKPMRRETRFEKHRRFSSKLVAATTAQEEGGSGRRSIFTVSDLREVGDTDVRNKAKVPEVNAQAKVLDFRKPDALRNSLYADAPMVTWKPQPSGDTYKVDGTSSASNLAAHESDEGWAGKSNVPRLVAIGLVVLAVVAIPLVLRWKTAARR